MIENTIFFLFLHFNCKYMDLILRNVFYFEWNLCVLWFSSFIYPRFQFSCQLFASIPLIMSRIGIFIVRFRFWTFVYLNFSPPIFQTVVKTMCHDETVCVYFFQIKMYFFKSKYMLIKVHYRVWIN